MKTKILLWLFIVVFLQACAAQKGITKEKEELIIDTYDKHDVIVTDVKDGSNLSFHFKNIKNGNHFFELSEHSTSLMDLKNKNNKLFYFYNNQTKMKIDCKCRMGENYYLKNLKIKDGKYKLTYKKGTRIKGNQIKVSDSIQNVIFKNIRLNQFKNPEDIYFKNLEFTVIDLSDTLNVKLEKVNN